jgi:ribosome-associated heat shock protein Hsp15
VSDEDRAALPSRVRVDVWLDVACLYKTRSEAQRACKGGKVEVNGVRARPNREVQAGDEVVLTRGPGRKQTVRVRAVVDQHIPKAQARALYEDMTPLPSPEELAWRSLLRAGPRAPGAGAPGKRDRRLLRRLKGM